MIVTGNAIKMDLDKLPEICRITQNRIIPPHTMASHCRTAFLLYPSNIKNDRPYFCPTSAATEGNGRPLLIQLAVWSGPQPPRFAIFANRKNKYRSIDAFTYEVLLPIPNCKPARYPISPRSRVLRWRETMPALLT